MAETIDHTTAENQVQAQPCPFCGKDPVLTECRDVKDDYVHGYMIWCAECGIEMTDEYKDEVLTVWNRRASGEPVPADVAELVVAARIVAFEDQSAEALARLDKASEAFAGRVGWDDEPLEEEASLDTSLIEEQANG